MVIKSSKQYAVIVAAMFACVIAFSVILWLEEAGILFLVIADLVLLALVVRYWIATCRTLTMDGSGCTVSFLWYHKHYKWENLETKAVENYTNHVGYLQHYTAGAIFYRRKIKKPSWLMPLDYNLFFHPFNFFFVYFTSVSTNNKGAYQCPDIYVINENVFREKMESWGIKLQKNF